MSIQRVIVVAHGDLEDLAFYKNLVKAGDFIICVNGGCGYALSMGIKPDLVIGDMDSLKPGDQEKIRKQDPRLIKHPSAKDKSDLELAIDKAVEMKPGEILIIGALGGERADHAFINMLLLYIPYQHNIPARIIDRNQDVFMIKGEAIIEGKSGDYFSLFSLTGKAEGIITEGLKYPLHGGTLYFASTLGLSNEFVGSKASVYVEKGLLLAIHNRKQGQSPGDEN